MWELKNKSKLGNIKNKYIKSQLCTETVTFYANIKKKKSLMLYYRLHRINLYSP